ncbi:MAG: GntR family transcriptional regulator [Chloroflexota bacterium]
MARRPTLKSLAHNAIRDAVLSGRLPPGFPISEPQLQEMLGIGRTPIREALEQLAGENLVVLVPHKGAVVPAVKAEDLWDVFLVREALEGLAAALCAQRMPSEEIEALSNTYKDLEGRSSGLRRDELHAFGARLHHTIKIAARSPHLSQSLSAMNQQIARLGDYQFASGGRPWVSLREHGEIITAIAARDPEVAEAAMRRHVRHSAETAIQLLVGAGTGDAPGLANHLAIQGRGGGSRETARVHVKA